MGAVVLSPTLHVTFILFLVTLIICYLSCITPSLDHLLKVLNLQRDVVVRVDDLS